MSLNSWSRETENEKTAKNDHEFIVQGEPSFFFRVTIGCCWIYGFHIFGGNIFKTFAVREECVAVKPEAWAGSVNGNSPIALHRPFIS